MHISIPKRVGVPAQNVVSMQARFEYMHGKRVMWLLQQSRFRAAYDLMLLRTEFEMETQEIADWWTQIQTLEPQAQEELIFAKSANSKKKTGTRKRSRKKPRSKKVEK